MNEPHRHPQHACLECDLLVRIGEVREGQSASCPRCGHVLTSRTPNGPTRALAYALSAGMLLLMANAFPFLAIEAGGLERVMTLPGSAIELQRDGYTTLAILVAGPIVGIPALMLATLVAILLPLRRGRGVPWLVPAGRFLFAMNPWQMVEVFLIGVLVSLVKIAGMANVVMGVSFWAYVGFSLCFIAAMASLDRAEIWEDIEECLA